jgi:hypothetical protein
MYSLILGALISIIVYFSLTLNVQYYETADLLGPFSKFPVLFTALAVIIGALIFVASRQENGMVVAYSACLLLILYAFVLPTAIEPNYATDFYDTPMHVTRALYVAQTGHSNPFADPYYGLQPGAFYATSIFMLATDIGPSVITKWFNVLFLLAAFLPSLAFLGKSVLSNRLLPLYFCVTLLLTWPGRYHYSAQVYCLPLFVFATALVTRYLFSKRSTQKEFFVILIMFPAIVICHQLLALATFIMLATASMWSTLVRDARSKSPSVLGITLVFALIWIVYLLWLSMFVFGDLLTTFVGIVGTLFAEGLLPLISKAIVRPNPSYQQLIYAKVSFTAVTYIASSIVLAFMWLKRRLTFGLVLLTMMGISAVIYLLGFPLGGTSYVERAVLVTGFLAAIGLTCGISSLPRRRIFALVAAILLISLTLAGTVLLNSARNFQSETYAEGTSTVFLDRYEPNNRNPLFIDMRVPDMTDATKVDYGSLATQAPKYDALLFRVNRFIEVTYSAGPEYDPIRMADRNVMLLRVYSSGFASVYLANGA